MTMPPRFPFEFKDAHMTSPTDPDARRPLPPLPLEAMDLWERVNIDPESGWRWKLDDEKDLAVIRRLIRLVRAERDAKIRLLLAEIEQLKASNAAR